MEQQRIGEVFDYYAKVGVIALKLEAPLKLGETIRIKGGDREIEQVVTSMQINHQPVQEAKKGADVGIKVEQDCRKGDAVFKVASEAAASVKTRTRVASASKKAPKKQKKAAARKSSSAKKARKKR